MSTTFHPGAARQPVTPAPPGRPLPTRHRRPMLMAVAVVVVVGCALAGLVALQQAGAKYPVLVMAKTVPAGHPITADDLGVVRVAGSIAHTPAFQKPSVVGKIATKELAAGQLLTASMMTSTPVPDATHALIGLSVKPGMLPAAGLHDGSLVQVVFIHPAGSADIGVQAGGVAPGDVVATATVFDVTGAPGSTGGVVTLLVARDGAAQLQAAAAAGDLVLTAIGG